MKKSVWYGLVVGLGLLIGARQGWAFEYLRGAALTSNQFFVGSGEARTLVGPKVGGLVGEVPAKVGLRADPNVIPQEWTLIANLRDASCPDCVFPAAEFPSTFSCSIPLASPSCKDSTWAIAAKFAGVIVEPGGPPLVQRVILEQDTRNIQATCSYEDNLFIYQETELTEDQNPPLVQLQGLTARFYQKINRVDQLDTCPAPLDLAGTLVGVKFVNTTTQQVLNYQVETFDSREAEFNGAYWSFQAANGETVYGVSDSLGVYGIGQLKVLVTGKIFSLPILKRVKQLIKANPLGLDPNLRHWKVKAFFAGSTTNGHAFIQSDQMLLGLEGF